MDTTATVNRMRELTSTLVKDHLESKHSVEGVELAIYFKALDSWLCKNGALPEQWKYKDK